MTDTRLSCECLVKQQPYYAIVDFCPLHAKANELREMLDRTYNYIVDQQFGDNDAILTDIEVLQKEIDNGTPPS